MPQASSCRSAAGRRLPSYCGFSDDFFPAKLIGVPLRQCGASVVMLHDRQLEGQCFGIGKEVVRGKHRHGDGNEMCTAGQQDDDDHSFEPSESQSFRLARFCLRLGIDRGFDHDCTRGEQHGIDRGEIVIFSVKDKEGGEAHQVAPAQCAVRLEGAEKSKANSPVNQIGAVTG